WQRPPLNQPYEGSRLERPGWAVVVLHPPVLGDVPHRCGRVGVLDDQPDVAAGGLPPRFESDGDDDAVVAPVRMHVAPDVNARLCWASVLAVLEPFPPFLHALED